MFYVQYRPYCRTDWVNYEDSVARHVASTSFGILKQCWPFNEMELRISFSPNGKRFYTVECNWEDL